MKKHSYEKLDLVECNLSRNNHIHWHNWRLCREANRSAWPA